MTSLKPTTLPAACPVAFKEWAGICAALADGRQALILRKGGIAEGDFRPEHDAFWLYPTFVHQAEQGLRIEAPEAPADLAERVPLLTLAVVAGVARIDSADDLPALEPFHVWTAETVLKKFHYRRPGLWALFVRAYNRAEPWPVAVTPEHAGCKTWVPLADQPPTTGLTPALDDDASARRLDDLLAALARGVGA